MRNETMKKMRGLAAAAAVAAGVLAAAPASWAAVAHGLPAGTRATPIEQNAPEDNAAVEAAPIEKIGCYRLGERGYTWYPFCVGPHWLYPHRRVCRHGACWYR